MMVTDSEKYRGCEKERKVLRDSAREREGRVMARDSEKE